MIVFAYHRKVLENLAETFNAPLLYGSTSLKERHRLVKEFQEGKHPVIICSIQAAGVGITLTASHHVVFVEFPWTPSEYDQAYGRAHRKTQTKQVHVVDLVSEHPLDVRQSEILQNKRFICDTIIDGNPYETALAAKKTILRDILEAA